MKYIRFIGVITFVQFIAGCSSTPGPQLVSGNYYMTGGSKCESFRYSDDPTVKNIICYNADGQSTGKIDAMSISDLKKYAYEKLKENAKYDNERNKVDASWNTDVYKEKNTAYKVTKKTN